MFIIPSQYVSLEYQRDIDWKEIFDTWREGEASQKSWQDHWIERGFKSWDEWRTAYAKPFHPQELQWKLYSVTNPLQDAPELYGTPTNAWVQKAYAGAITKALKEILGMPIITENDKVIAIKEDFPKKTLLTGLLIDGKIVLVEGMHRACALASWYREELFESEVSIALAEWSEEVPTLGGNYKKFDNGSIFQEIFAILES